MPSVHCEGDMKKLSARYARGDARTHAFIQGAHRLVDGSVVADDVDGDAGIVLCGWASTTTLFLVEAPVDCLECIARAS